MDKIPEILAACSLVIVAICNSLTAVLKLLITMKNKPGKKNNRRRPTYTVISKK